MGEGICHFYVKMKEMWNISTISSGDIPKLRNGLVGINCSTNFSDLLDEVEKERKRKKIHGAGISQKNSGFTTIRGKRSKMA